MNNCNRSNLCFRESSLRVDTHRLCLKPHPTPSFTSPYISSLYSPLDRVIENIWVNSDTDEHLLLTNTITEGKNQKQNYNWHTATALNVKKKQRMIKQLHKQHHQLRLLLTSLTSFLSYIRIRISFICQVCANTRGICCGFRSSWYIHAYMHTYIYT